MICPLKLGFPLDLMETCIVGFVEGLGEYRSGDCSSGSSSVMVDEAEKCWALDFIIRPWWLLSQSLGLDGSYKGATQGMSLLRLSCDMVVVRRVSLCH